MTLPTDITTPTSIYTGCENPEYENREGQRVDSNKQRFESKSIADKLSKSETSIIEAGRWVFFSNGLVAYWPISKRIFLNGKKCLNFHQPTGCIFISILYIFFNITYVLVLFVVKERNGENMVDVILDIMWDLLLVVSVILYRIYCIVCIRQFHSFWNGLISLVAQMTELSSENETKDKFDDLRRWTLKCLIAYAVLGIADCGVVIYLYGIDDHGDGTVLIHMLYIYFEAVLSMHSSSALMLVFLIKIITYGFTVCRRKVEQLAVDLKPYKLELGGGTRSIYSASGQVNGAYLDNEHGEIVQSSSSSLILTQTLKLVNELENCVEDFNHLFGFGLFLEAFLGFWQIIFAMNFLADIENGAGFVHMSVPITICSASLVMLCVASSSLTEECLAMLTSFQNLPAESLSADENYKMQVLVSRLSPNPSGIQVAQLFKIRESFLGVTLNALATNFIVLLQIKQDGQGMKCMCSNTTGNINSTEKPFGDFGLI